MLRNRYVVAAGVALVVAASAVYYAASTGESQTGHYPQVAGRLLDRYAGEGYDGVGFTGFCEYDAFVGVAEGNVVVKVLEQGSRGVEVGTKVIGTIFVGPVEGRGEGLSGVQNIGAYWGDDGNLYGGCAPESIAVRDDGTTVRIKDLPKPGDSQP